MPTLRNSFPREFFRPAPLRQPAQSSAEPQDFEALIASNHTAEVWVLRLVSVVGGASWILVLALGRQRFACYTNPGSHTSCSLVEMVINITFACCAIASIIAALFCSQKACIVVSLTSSLVYMCILGVHAAFLWNTGSSPLTPAHIGDYSVAPVIMLVAAIGTKFGITIALFMLLVSSITNLGTPFGINLALEVGFAFLCTAIFAIILVKTRQAAMSMDMKIRNHQREALLLSRSQTLNEAEARFISYVHDQVLALLNAMRHGNAPADFDLLQHKLPSDSTNHDTLRMPVAGIVTSIQGVIKSIAPDTIFYVSHEESAETEVPATVVVALLDLLTEAAKNSVTHAATARRSCTFHAEDGQFFVRFSDDGPGFNLSDIRQDRVGVRLTILERFNSTQNCISKVISSPDAGTSVEATWSQPQHDHSTTMLSSEQIDLFNLMGLDVIFGRFYLIALLVWGVAMGLHRISADHLAPQVTAIIIFVAYVAILAYFRTYRLPLIPTMCTAVLLAVFFVSGLWTNATADNLWPAYWYVSLLPIMCLLLAIRGRAFIALGLFSIFVSITAAFSYYDISTLHFLNNSPTPLDMIGYLPIIVAGMGAPWLVTKLMTYVPVSETARLRQQLTQDRVQATSEHLSACVEWLRDLLIVALDPALSENTRRSNAHLLELRIRDSIRSPLFDQPDVNIAVWFARVRGVRVRLFDDHSSCVAEDRLLQFHMRLATLLHSTSNGEITARIFPAHRSRFASIVADGPAGAVSESFDGVALPS